LRDNLQVDIKLTEVFVWAGEILFPEDFHFRWLLYNLKKDPFEKNDLLEKGKGKIIARKLFEVLKSEAKIHGDELEFGKYLALN
jgi:hypothetical protein